MIASCAGQEIGEIPFKDQYSGAVTVSAVFAPSVVYSLPMERHRKLGFKVAAVSLAGAVKGQVFATGWWAGRGWL